jgi:hypothetical protein
LREKLVGCRRRRRILLSGSYPFPEKMAADRRFHAQDMGRFSPQNVEIVEHVEHRKRVFCPEFFISAFQWIGDNSDEIDKSVSAKPGATKARQV